MPREFSAYISVTSADIFGDFWVSVDGSGLQSL